MRICETLYYHCENDSAYIEELYQALHDIGLDIENKERVEYKLKDTFKSDSIYTDRLIFLNKQVENGKVKLAHRAVTAAGLPRVIWENAPACNGR